MSESKYGTVTIGCETTIPKELEIENFIQATFKDNRVICVSELEDGTYLVAVENPTSSGRSILSTIRLSKESLTGLLATILFYFNSKRVDIMTEISEAITRDHVDYQFSNNLQPFDKDFH